MRLFRIFRRKPKKPLVHVITPFHDPGTGRGDDKSGWNCACGTYGFALEAAQRHLDEMAQYAGLPTVEEVRG
jgi:hypothetical protein